MTKAEAKKVLDYLCLRWCKRVYTIMSHGKIYADTSPDIKSFKHSLFIDDNQRIALSFKWDVHQDNRADEIWSFSHELWIKDVWNNEQDHDKMFFVEEHPKTTEDMLRRVFSEKKEVFAAYYPLIDEGESLEEIKVKADLEEINDRG